MTLSAQRIPASRPIPQPEVISHTQVERPTVIQKTAPIEEPAKNEASNFNSLDITKMALDALLRGIFRFSETFISNPLSRIGFRGVSETARKSAEVIGFKALKGEKITKSDWKTMAVRTLENTASSAFFEPNQYTNRFARMGVGLANMVIRFTTRAALFALKVIDTEALGLDNFIDELSSRSIFRAISTSTTNPILGVGTRFLEQLGINTTVHLKPIKGYLTKQFNALKQKVA